MEVTEDEKKVLEFLYATSADPGMSPAELCNFTVNDNEIKLTEETIASICGRLLAKELIISVYYNGTSNYRTHYFRISANGIRLIRPDKRQEKLYQLMKIGVIFGIIAAISSIISVIK